MSGCNDDIKGAVLRKYAGFARGSQADFNYPTGREGARRLGYPEHIIAEAPEAMIRGFCGVGNPFSLGEPHPSETVLDIGCGTGFDLLVASRYVGDTGWVCGVDMTHEMVELAKSSLSEAGVSGVSVINCEAEELPWPNDTFDMAISNGVINLSPDKQRIFSEIFRVLKPGGCLQFADIVLKEELPDEITGSLEAWSH